MPFQIILKITMHSKRFSSGKKTSKLFQFDAIFQFLEVYKTNN